MIRTGAKRTDRRFFALVTIMFVLLTFVGFSRTYFLHTLFHIPAPSTFIAFHGALITEWVLLLLVQALLVSVGRLKCHRKLGVVGIAYAALIIPIGCLATLGAARREVRAHSGFVESQLHVLGLELTRMEREHNRQAINKVQ